MIYFEPEPRVRSEPSIYKDEDDEDEDNMPLSQYASKLRLPEEAVLSPSELAKRRLAIPADVINAVKRLHNNLGHPELKTLVRALVTAGATPQAIEAAKLLRCDVCARLKPPHTRRPSVAERASNFGDKVAIDLFVIDDIARESFTFVNIIDIATRFQVCTLAKSKRPDDVWDAFERAWLCWAGPPDKLVADQGGEFFREFSDFMEAHGVQITFTGTQAPWQNGVCERHGGAWKLAARHSILANSVKGVTEMKAMSLMVNWAKNARINASGFSPSQWVLGRQQRLPWSLLTGAGRLGELSAAEEPVFAKRIGLLHAARRAFEVLDTSDRLRRAWLARSRVLPESQFFPVDEVVYFWQPKDNKVKHKRTHLSTSRWHGPGRVVGMEGSSVWISYRGTLTKRASEHVRKATPEEIIAFGRVQG